MQSKKQPAAAALQQSTGAASEHEDFVVERRYSEWQRKDVRTIIVNSRSKIASQRSINQALRIANPFDRIELVGGEYFESISVSFPVELVAAEGEDVKIVFRGQCLTVATDCACFVADIEFNSKSRGRADAALVVSLGKPILQRCRFSSVQLCGAGFATIERCEIFNSVSGVGLRAIEKGGGKISDTRIHSHGSCCVDVDTSGALEFQSCQLYQPHRGTVVAISATASSYADGPGRACRLVLFANCKIYAVDAPVVVDALRAAIGEEATPMLSSTGEKACVIISHGSEPSFQSNELSQGDIGFLLETGGKARLTANVIRMQKKCGLSVILPPPVEGTDALLAPAIVLDGGNLFDRCRVGVDVAGGGVGRTHSSGLAPWVAAPSTSPPIDASASAASSAGGQAVLFPRDGSLRHMTQLDRQLLQLLRDLVVSQFAPNQPVAAGAPLTLLMADGKASTTSVVASSAAQRGGGSGSSILTPVGGAVSYLSHLLDGEGGGVSSAAAAATSASTVLLRTDPSAVKAAALRLRVAAGACSFGIEVSEAKFFSCPDGGVVFRAGTRGLVKNCEFLQCQSTAVMVCEYATPIIVSCIFSQCPLTSVQLQCNADPVIACNDFSGNAGSGLLLDTGSLGLVLGNRVHGNSNFGVVSLRGSRSVLFGNEIRENIKGGIHAAHRSCCAVVRNQLTGNFHAQLLVEDFSTPLVALNHVASGPGYGAIVFSSCSAGILRENTVVNNKYDGLVIELDADPLVTDNDLCDNDAHGLVVRNSGAGCIVGNRICRNRQANVSLSEGAYATLRGNHIEAGHLGGVHIHDEGSGLLEKNMLVANNKANLMLADSHTNPRVDRNTITGCRTGPGVLCWHKCSGVIARNVISDNKTCGVSILSEGNPTILQNSVFRETIGIAVAAGGKGVVEQNELYDNSIAGIVCESYGAPRVTLNNVTNNRGCGFLLTSDASGVFTRNKVAKNEVGVQCGGVSYFISTAAMDAAAAVEAVAAATTSSAASTARGAKKTPPPEPLASTTTTGGGASTPSPPPVFSLAGPLPPLAVLSENSITENIVCGVLLEEDANSSFLRNTITRNARYGVLGDVTVALHRRQAVLGSAAPAAAAGAGTTTAAGAASSGVDYGQSRATRGTAQASFDSNAITHHGVANICFLSHAMNEFLFAKNTIEEAPRGVLVRGSSYAGIYRGNTIRGCVEGITVEENSRGQFEGNSITWCTMCGVYVGDGANPTFTKRNAISNCSIAGIFVDVGGKGLFAQCDVSLCGMGCVSTCPPPTAGAAGGRSSQSTDGDSAYGDFQATTPIVEDCVFARNRVHGIAVLSYDSLYPLRSYREARADFTSSSFTSKVVVGGSGSPKMTYGRDHKCEERLCPTFRRNTVAENRFAGVFHERFVFIATNSGGWGDASPDSTTNELNLSHTRTPAKDGGGDDSPTKRKGRAVSTAGSTRRPHVNMASPRQKSAVPRRGSQFADRAALGSDSMEYSSSEQEHLRFMLQCAAFVDNTITRNTFGVIVSGETDPFFLRNIIAENAFYGVLMRATSRPFFFGCTVSGNGLGGVYCCRFASGSVEECTVSANNGLYVAPNAAAASATSAAGGTTVISSDMSAAAATLASNDQRFAALRAVLAEYSYKTSSAANSKFAALCSPGGGNGGSTSTSPLAKGCEQLALLLEVHEIVLQGSTDLLEDVVAAGRSALTIASYLLPNPYASSSPSSSAALRSSDMAEAAKLMEASNTVPVSDGAVGFFLEHGSQVEVVRCVVEQHKAAGALFTCSVLGHQFLQKSNIGVASRSHLVPPPEPPLPKGKGTTAAAPAHATEATTPQRRRPHDGGSGGGSPVYTIPTPGVLFTQQPLINNAATAGSSDDTLLERAWIGTEHQQQQLLHGTDASERSISFGATNRSTAAAAPPAKASGLGSDADSSSSKATARKQAGAPMIRDCTFRGNRDGARIQLFQAHQANAAPSAGTAIALLKASSSATSTASGSFGAGSETGGMGLQKSTSGSGKWGVVRQRSKQLARSTSQSSVDGGGESSGADDLKTLKTLGSQPSTASSATAAVLQHVFDGELEILHYAIALQANTFERQTGHGVYLEQVVEVGAGVIFPTPHAMTQLYNQQIVAITKAKSVLRETSSGAASASSPSPAMSDFSVSNTSMTVRPFGVTSGRAGVSRHAKVTGNTFRANGGAHVFLTSKFVVVTGDRSRTLLNVGTQGETLGAALGASFASSASSSIFAASNVMSVPVLRDLLQSPPPGVVLIAENRFENSEIGVRLCGLLSSGGCRVRGNIFAGHTKAAVLLEGMRACATISDGNVFEKNAIGVLLSHDPFTAHATANNSSSGVSSSPLEDSSGGGGGVGGGIGPDMTLIDCPQHGSTSSASSSSGHGASAAVGVGGCFSQQFLWTTKIMKNLFRANSDFGIALVANLPPCASFPLAGLGSMTPELKQVLSLPWWNAPVIFSNSFVEQRGCPAVAALGAASTAIVTRNIFSRNSIGLLVGPAATTPSASMQQRPVSVALLSGADAVLSLEQNTFQHNDVGLAVMATGGPAIGGRLNLFKWNVRAGTDYLSVASGGGDSGGGVSASGGAFPKTPSPPLTRGPATLSGGNLLAPHHNQLPALKLQDCAFEHHHAASVSLLQEVPLSVGGKHLLGSTLQVPYRYPPCDPLPGAAAEDGGLRREPSVLDAKGTAGGPLASASASPQHPPLCSGIVLRCATGAVLERCAFLANHVGAELLVAPPLMAGMSRGRGRDSVLSSCVFQTNVVGLLSHHHLPVSGGGSGSAAPSRVSSASSSISLSAAPSRTPSRLEDITSLGRLPSTPAELIANADDRAAQFESSPAITVRNCLLENNVEQDVVVRNGGHVKLIANLLQTGVSLEHFALGYFSKNVIVGAHRAAALVASAGSLSVLARNFFYQCRIGARCAGHSYPLFLNNTLFECAKGFDVDASCGAAIVGNLVTNASDCCASVRGAVLAKNEFCLSPVGLLVPSSSSAAAAALVTRSPRVAPSRLGSAAVHPPQSVHITPVTGHLLPPPSSSVASMPAGSPSSLGFSSAMMTLASFDLFFSENVVHSCDSDGILIGGGGTFEANRIYNNRVNINVVYQLHLAQGIQNSLVEATLAAAAAAGGGGGASTGGGLTSSGVPSIVRNTIYDASNIGVLASPSSVAILTQNDIFDNKVFGLCCESRSQLVAEGNNVSCPNMKGAVDVAQDSECQLHRNTVRNQFSPVYLKTLQPARIKDRAGHLSQLADRVQGEVSEYHSLSAMLRDTVADLLKRHADLATVVGSAALAAEHAVHADASLVAMKSKQARWEGSASGGGGGGGARTPQGTSLDASGMLDDESDTEHPDGTAGSGVTRSKSTGNLRLKSAVMMVRKMERRMSVGSSSAASLKKLTRANSNALELEEDIGVLSRRASASGGGGGPSLAGHVLVHVLTPGHLPPSASMASSAGNVVAGTLRSSHLVQLTTVVTTDPSAVSSVMKAQLPTSVVLVVPPHLLSNGPGDAGAQYVTSIADSELLFRLDRTTTTRKTSNGLRMQCFVLVPEDLRRFFMMKKFSAVKAPGGGSDGATTGGGKKGKASTKSAESQGATATATGTTSTSRKPSAPQSSSFTRSLEDFSDFHTMLFYDGSKELTGLEELVRSVLASKLHQQATGAPATAAAAAAAAATSKPPPNASTDRGSHATASSLSTSQQPSALLGGIAFHHSLLDVELRPNEVHSLAPSPQPGVSSSARVMRTSPPRSRGNSPQPRRIMSPQPASTTAKPTTLPPIADPVKKKLPKK